MSFNTRNVLSEIPSYDVVEKDWPIKVNANECGMNLPPMVAERVMSRLSRIAFNRYPNEQYLALTEAIGRSFGLQPDNVLLGSGSSEIIEKVFYAFGGGRDRKIVYPWPSFSMYPIYAKAAEAEGVAFELSADDNYELDPKKFIDFVKKENPSLVVICNPNNPTGIVIKKSDVEYIAQNVDCALLIDEAYIDFDISESVTDVLLKYPNMMIARTFSKAFGLASARVGYMLASKSVVDIIGRAFMPYHMNVLSLVTADTAFTMRDEFIPRINMMISERKRMESELKKIDGIKVYESNTNFIFMNYDKAVQLNEALEGQGIGIRSFGNAPLLTNCIRISMGTREENDVWLKAVMDFVEASV